MSWLFESTTYESKKNGNIHCFRFLCPWNVRVNEYDQTTPYTSCMWKEALENIPNTSLAPKRILMLGLGAGGAVKKLYQRFQNCKLTVVEWDPVMIQISKTLGLYRRHHPKIILGEAFQQIKKMKTHFDLILVDLFTGKKVAPVVYRKNFMLGLKKILAVKGSILLNIFTEKHLLKNFDTVFSCKSTWQFQYNTLGLYRKKLGKT